MPVARALSSKNTMMGGQNLEDHAIATTLLELAVTTDFMEHHLLASWQNRDVLIGVAS